MWPDSSRKSLFPSSMNVRSRRCIAKYGREGAPFFFWEARSSRYTKKLLSGIIVSSNFASAAFSFSGTRFQEFLNLETELLLRPERNSMTPLKLFNLNSSFAIEIMNEIRSALSDESFPVITCDASQNDTVLKRLIKLRRLGAFFLRFCQH